MDRGNGNGLMLTLPEVAVQLGISVATVRRMIERDGLPAIKVGRQYRVSARAFEHWCGRLDLRQQ